MILLQKNKNRTTIYRVYLDSSVIKALDLEAPKYTLWDVGFSFDNLWKSNFKSLDKISNEQAQSLPKLHDLHTLNENIIERI